MIKRLTFIIMLTTLLVTFLSAFTRAQIVTVEFSKQKDAKPGLMIYHLVFKRGKVIIAKRSYHNGETILEEGKIPDGIVVENYKDGKVKNIMFLKMESGTGLQSAFMKVEGSKFNPFTMMATQQEKDFILLKVEQSRQNGK